MTPEQQREWESDEAQPSTFPALQGTHSAEQGTHSAEQGSRVAGEGSKAQEAREGSGARVARYAEAIWPAEYGRFLGSPLRDLADEQVRRVLAVADAELAESRAEVERLRSWLPPRIVEQPLLFGTANRPRHVVSVTEDMRTYCDTCSAEAQDWVTPDECPQLAAMDVPAVLASEAEVTKWRLFAHGETIRAEAAEAERDALRAAAAVVVKAWDDFGTYEPCSDCLRSGVGLVDFESDERMDRAADSLRAVLARSQAPQAPAEQEGDLVHLVGYLDAQPLSACDSCGRKTWDEESVGEPCGMRQPDGSTCAGTFPVPSVRPATADDEPNAEFCALSEHVDGPHHTWRFDGDDPYIVCHWCDEVRDAQTGRVIREGNDPKDVLGGTTADDEGVRRG